MPSPLRESTREAYHAMEHAEVVRRLDVDPAHGLSQDEVARRRARDGENRLAGDAGVHPLILLGRQFADLMVVVLLVAAAVAGLIGEAMDAIAIMVIVALNAIIGFIQEYRAERALTALQGMSAPRSGRRPRGGGRRAARRQFRDHRRGRARGPADLRQHQIHDDQQLRRERDPPWHHC